MLTLSFDMRCHFAAVSEFVEAGSAENRNFWTYSLQPRHQSRPRGMCVKSLPEIAHGSLGEVTDK